MEQNVQNITRNVQKKVHKLYKIEHKIQELRALTSLYQTVLSESAEYQAVEIVDHCSLSGTCNTH